MDYGLTQTESPAEAGLVKLTITMRKFLFFLKITGLKKTRLTPLI